MAGNNVPQAQSTPAVATATASASALESLDAKITAQGNTIRDLKSKKAAKEAIEAEVKKLLSLKSEFKQVAGKDWDPKGKYKINVCTASGG